VSRGPRRRQTFGAGCADVQDLSACATVTSAEGTYTACRLVRTDNDISDPGDSGGPWYWGTTAYGIHWGTFDTVFGDRSAFSRATYVDEALNGTTLLH
jgi:streptogrisin C